MAVWAVSCRALGHACRQGLRLTSMHAGPCALLSLTGVWLQEGRTRRSVNIHALQRSHDQKTGGHSTCRHAHARTLRAHTHTCEGTCAHKKQTKTQMHAQKLHAGADTHCSACMQKCTHTHAPPPWTGAGRRPSLATHLDRRMPKKKKASMRETTMTTANHGVTPGGYPGSGRHVEHPLQHTPQVPCYYSAYIIHHTESHISTLHPSYILILLAHDIHHTESHITHRTHVKLLGHISTQRIPCL